MDRCLHQGSHTEARTPAEMVAIYSQYSGTPKYENTVLPAWLQSGAYQGGNCLFVLLLFFFGGGGGAIGL